jgi:hypothetical protein
LRLKSGAASSEKRGIWHKEDAWELHHRKKKEEGEHARKKSSREIFNV